MNHRRQMCRCATMTTSRRQPILLPRVPLPLPLLWLNLFQCLLLASLLPTNLFLTNPTWRKWFSISGIWGNIPGIGDSILYRVASSPGLWPMDPLVPFLRPCLLTSRQELIPACHFPKCQRRLLGIFGETFHRPRMHLLRLWAKTPHNSNTTHLLQSKKSRPKRRGHPNCLGR